MKAAREERTQADSELAQEVKSDQGAAKRVKSIEKAHAISNAATDSPSLFLGPEPAFTASFGVIGGSSFLKGTALSHFRPVIVETAFGRVRVYRSPLAPAKSPSDRPNAGAAFVQRHFADPDRAYVPPHLINRRAIAAAFKLLQCSSVVGFGSVGSLQPATFPVGTLSVPNDFVDHWHPQVVSFFDFSAQGHKAPNFDATLRSALVAELQKEGVPFKDGGVYVQTVGPRFETAAEVRQLAREGDVVGMTCGHEAILLSEINLPYAVVCMADNMANGLSAAAGSVVEEYHKGAHHNFLTMERVLKRVLSAFVPAEYAASVLNPGPDSVPSGIQVDQVINARFVVPLDPANPRAVMQNASVVVHEGRIVEVLPASEAAVKYAPTELTELGEHVLMPGFVNAHGHSGMTLLRGYADDHSLMEWLTQYIWPAEAEHVNPEFVRDSVELACAEMIRSGTTMVNDMYFHPKETAETMARVGIRGVVGLCVLDFPTAYAKDAADYLVKAEEARARISHPHIKFAMAPHAPYTVCDENLLKVKQVADANRLPIHVHLHETAAEVDNSKSGNSTAMGCHRSPQLSSPVANFDRLGLLNSSLIAVHMVHLSDDEIKLCAQRGVNIVHCPSSNLKLASGFCPVAKLLANGVNVAIGTDSSASNNALDMFSEMRTAALLSKGVTGDATTVPAWQALQMATINGAKAVGMESELGSLSKGKWADITAVHLINLEMVPLYDVISHLVYVADRHMVSDVWVAGKRLLQGRRLTTIDEPSILANATKWSRFIAASKDRRATSRDKAASSDVSAQETETVSEAVLSHEPVVASSSVDGHKTK